MKNIQFSAEEKQLLVEALLFSSVPDICAEWTPRQEKLMIELAKKLNDDTSAKLNSIYLFEGGVFDNPEHVKEVQDSFPNLPRTSVIED